jgi:hypothetical protein
MNGSGSDLFGVTWSTLDQRELPETGRKVVRSHPPRLEPELVA